MKQLSHKTIEDLLWVVENSPKKNFGDFFNYLAGNRNLVVEKSGSPDKAYFSYRVNRDFGLAFESSAGAINAAEGLVKSCEIVFFKKYQINQRASPLLATDNLERLFSDAFAFRSDLKSFSSALEKLGFVYDINALAGEYLIGKHKAYVSVGLREIDRSLHITMKVRPIYKP